MRRDKATSFASAEVAQADRPSPTDAYFFNSAKLCLLRVAGTIANAALAAKDVSAAQIAALDAGSWFSAK
jgi:hypothetical protein